MENIYLEKNLNQIKELKSMDDVFGVDLFEVNADFVEQYIDQEGITHLKTVLKHNEIKENELWEVFDISDCASPLELLLDI